MTQPPQPAGVLAFWTDIVADCEADFNEWYNREHFPERLGVPGFVNGARYRAIHGDRRYLAFYEVESLAVLQAPAYLERLNNPTPWTRRVMPKMQGAIRAACTLRHREGAGRGGVAAALRLAPLPERGEALAGWLVGEAAPAMAALPGVVSVLFLQCDPDPSGAPTAERKLREDADQTAEWIVIVEGETEAAVNQALAAQLTPQALAGAGAAPQVQQGLYRLLYSLQG